MARSFLLSEEYSTQRYASLLSRAPDSGGLAYWVSGVSNGTAFQKIQNGFLTSDEYRARSFIRF
ncbi:DUF4214 domain-containing protein [Spirillospora sp. CA-294931]|uniref:DUF4214 domain-containing protein n=1 Tax=Spirillospora sp. CA-294931 TaxID=3240042 RepID=UPI003D93ED03